MHPSRHSQDRSALAFRSGGSLDLLHGAAGMALAAALVSAHCPLRPLDGAADRCTAGAALDRFVQARLASGGLCPLRGGSRHPAQWWLAPRRPDRHGGWPRGASGAAARGDGGQPGGRQWCAGSRDGAAAAGCGIDPAGGAGPARALPGGVLGPGGTALGHGTFRLPPR